MRRRSERQCDHHTHELLPPPIQQESWFQKSHYYIVVDLVTPGQETLCQLVNMVLHTSHIREEEVRYHTGRKRGQLHNIWGGVLTHHILCFFVILPPLVAHFLISCQTDRIYRIRILRRCACANTRRHLQTTKISIKWSPLDSDFISS